MTLVLREILNHPLLSVADPQLLSGEDQLDHPVRWVHTADLYDIAPLLRGDEALLTNGVGLLAVDEHARRIYIRRLAEKGIAGLFFEIGRTFAEIPPEMIEEARELHLPVVVLQPVLRFTEVAEAVNSELIDHSVRRLRHADEISRGLSETLARGGTLTEIVEQVAAVLGTWAEVSDYAGRQVVAAGNRTADAPSAEVPIVVDTTAWARLTVGTDGPSSLLVDAVLDRAPMVIGLSLIRHQPDVTGSLRVRQLVLDQLVAGRPVAAGLLEERLQAAGLPAARHHFVCVAVDPERVADGARVLDKLVQGAGHGIFGLTDGALCAVIGARPEAGPSLGSRVRDAAQRLLRGQARACVAVGRTTRTVGDLPRTMAETRTSLRIAKRIQIAQPVVVAQSLAVERMLDSHPDDTLLHAFVNDALGPLIEADRAKGGPLLHTLQVLVECGGAKTAAADRLHLRRQSLYYRIGQIESLLDVDLADPRQLTTLSVAILARRMLSPDD
ncbi:PucR family transcriptional regulator ligand-binding domain-containing protein [Kribbella sp. NPDC048915]|uniref:PucR family transcriptional regulator n=1 Tax=Kribbella sp. NPDC048915 TaxID=3155148 RepID=UPI00340CB42F